MEGNRKSREMNEFPENLFQILTLIQPNIDLASIALNVFIASLQLRKAQ